MRAFFTSVAREFKLMFRNGISIFMIAAPAILALVFILVFGAVNANELSIAVDSTVSAAEEQKLLRIADVERFDDLSALKARVSETDAFVGITMESGTAHVLFEGNEGEEFIAATRNMVSLALGTEGDLMPYRSEPIAAKGNMAYTVSMIAMLLMSLFIGGATVGLGIVDEREGGAIRAVSVSPLRLGGYVAMKLFPALLLGLLGIAAAALIIGKASLVPQYLLLALGSVFVSGMMTFLVGAFANNQVAAVGVLKILVPVGMILPISAMFVPQSWQFVYYIQPMYWQYRALAAILSGDPALLFTLLTLLVSLPCFFMTLWMFAKKTNFRNSLR